MTVLGYPSTVAVTIEELLMLARAVRRGLRTPFLVGDLPFGSYEVSDEQAVATAFRFVKEAGCDAVKLEGGGRPVAPRPRDRPARDPRDGPRRASRRRPPPRSGGYKAQGRSAERGREIAEGALALQAAGCFSIVFEAIPSAVAPRLMERMEVPVIGIGAGPATDGQVLVFHDLLGIREGRGARFVQRYADLQPRWTPGSPRSPTTCAPAPTRAPSTATRSTTPSSPRSGSRSRRPDRGAAGPRQRRRSARTVAPWRKPTSGAIWS
jgi:3-methyl-2-oxobutanoate hydroxymethyltransferase